jgi:Protein of unknown function (DUF3592)
VKLIFIALPALFLALGLILVGMALVLSVRRRAHTRGWVEASATVTGNLHGRDGHGSNGRNRFAPSFEFHDEAGKRWLGQSDTYGPDQEIIGNAIPVRYNPANPAESTRPGFFIAKGRLSTGLIMVIFGAAGITMFASLLR